MAKSDEEFEISNICTPPLPELDDLDLNPENSALSSIYSWKTVKKSKPCRRYTVSHCGSPYNNGNVPPAPPSTPTSLTALLPDTATLTTCNSNPPNLISTTVSDDKRINHILCNIDFTSKYKKKLKELKHTDGELADLFKDITITTRNDERGRNGSSNIYGTTRKHLMIANNGIGPSNSNNNNKLSLEHGISYLSRNIRKTNTVKIFKIHRNPKDFLREPDEDSVSAPEYDTEEDETRSHRFYAQDIVRRRRRMYVRSVARLQQERMETIMDTFNTSMTIEDI